MTRIQEFQGFANKHWFVDKSRLTTCTFKKGAVRVTENRLWLWLCGDENPHLVKSYWLEGHTNSDYMASMFKDWIRQ